MIRGKANIDLRYESRWSFVENQVYTIKGVRIGAAFEKKLRLGIGYNWNKTQFESSTTTIDEFGNIEKNQRYFQLGYLLAYADVVFYRTKRWQLSVPIQIGAGATWFQEEAKYSIKNRQSKHFLFLYEPGITIQFKLTRWAGIGGDIAYRFTPRNNQINEQLNSPTFAFKWLLWIDQLYYMLVPNSEWTKKYGPAKW